MSKLVYNGVSVELLRTLEFDMGTERDPANVDVLWQVYTIRAVGLIVAEDGNPIANAGAVNIDLLKHKLQTPRRPLLYEMAGRTLVEVTKGPDAGLGPEPLPAVVKQVTDEAIFVELGYKVRLVDCLQSPSQRSPVVSLRWEQTEGFDQLWYSRLATKGRLIVRADLGQSADSFRALATPDVPLGFIRQTANYTMNRSGTELDFEFVDQEQYYMPPATARKASGRMMVVVQKGGKRMGQCDVRLEGGYNSPPRNVLMQSALRIAFTKLVLEGVVNLNLLEGSFGESLYENAVDVSLKCMLKPLAKPVTAPGSSSVPGSANTTLELFKTAGYTPSAGSGGIAPPVRRRIAGLLAAAFRDPCAASAVNSAEVNTTLTTLPGADAKLLPSVSGVGSSGSAGSSVAPTGGGGSGGSGFSLSVVDTLPPTSTPGSVTDSAPYDYYEIEAEYVEDSGRRQLPGTGTGDDGAKSAFVTVHGGLMRLECTFAARRPGQPPVLPTKESFDPNYTYLGGRLNVGGIEIGADGVTPIYTASGMYTYGVADPDKVTYFAPFPPFLSGSIGDKLDEAAGYVSKNILWRFRARGDNQDETSPPNDTATPLFAAGFGAIGGALGGSGSGGDGGGNFNGPPVNP